MFELELSARKFSKQLELPYKTVFKAVMVIRHAILAHAADGIKIIQSGEFELDESYFGGKRKENRALGVAATSTYSLIIRCGSVEGRFISMALKNFGVGRRNVCSSITDFCRDGSPCI